MSRFDSYNTDARQALALAREIAVRLQHKTICTEHILSGLLDANDPMVVTMMNTLGVSVTRVRQALEFVIGRGSRPQQIEPTLSVAARQALDLAEQEALAEPSIEVRTSHLLLGLLREGEGIAAGVLESFGVTYERAQAQFHAQQQAPMGMGAGFATEHIARYNQTPTLNMVSRDLTSAALADQIDPVIGREDEITQAMQVLSRRRKNNPVLIGPAGVGKTAIAEGLAQRIVNGQVPDMLRNKRLVSLDVGLLTIGTKYRGDFEERLKLIVEEILKTQNIILFIDELQILLGAGGAEGSIDAANLFKPILARGEFQCVGATTQDDFKKILDRDPALERRFQPVTVPESTVEETVEILRGLRSRYERFHHVRIADSALIAAAQLGKRYIQDRYLPDKAIDLLDEASARLRVSRALTPPDISTLREELTQAQTEKDQAISLRSYAQASKLRDREILIRAQIIERENEWWRLRTENDPSVTDRDIAEIVVRWTGIPAVQVNLEESQRLMALEGELHKRVIGQDEAVSSVARAVRRSRAELRDRRRPIGSFIFAGPTGVGKTELAKALAAALFGSEDALIKIDMSEFMERHNAARLTGSPPGYIGYDQAGQLTEAVRRRPFSIVLFDEIEKAHPQVFDLLLQILEDGQLSDAKGRVVDFRNTIVIMTTNVGADRLARQGGTMGFVRGKVGEDTELRDYAHMTDVVLEEMRQAFRPEFLNRLDDIILFHTLTKHEAREILELMLAQTQERLAAQMVKLRVTDDAQDYLIERGFNYEYGARSLRRTVQTMVEDRLAETLLLERIHSGDLVFVERNPTSDGSDDTALTIRPMAALPAHSDGAVADKSQPA